MLQDTSDRFTPCQMWTQNQNIICQCEDPESEQEPASQTKRTMDGKKLFLVTAAFIKYYLTHLKVVTEDILVMETGWTMG